MNNLDSVFNQRIFDGKGVGANGALSTEEQLSCLAIVWRVFFLSR
jgi:hypothetical protein